MGCITSGKMTMLMDILKSSESPEANSGNWTYVQDATSGALVKKWVDDDPSTPTVVEGNAIVGVPCMARGILGTGIRGVGTTQVFESIYQNVDWVRMSIPAGYSLTQRDKVTRIRDKDGNILWKESEIQGSPATIFTVMGITPIPGPLGAVNEYQVLLKRADIQ